MRTFTDKLGRTWKADLSAPILARIRLALDTDFNVVNLKKLQRMQRLLERRPEKRLALIEAVLGQQAAAAGISDAEFAAWLREPDDPGSPVLVAILTALVDRVRERYLRAMLLGELEKAYPGQVK
jgi:hypothetical protein